MTTQKRAVLYARVSGDDSGKDGRNLAGQIEMGREYATQHGYSVVAELPEDDKGASGADIDLPQLNHIREMAQAGEFDILIVREIDRLSRNLAKQLIVEEELKRAGVGIEYVIGEYADTPEGNFMKHVRASVAEFEREKIRERVVRGKRRIVKGGGVFVADHPLYGYKVKDEANKKTLEIYELEANIVRMIFNFYTIGDSDCGKPLTMYGIVRKLTAMRVPTPADSNAKKGRHRKRGYGEWNKATVYRILRNESYIGTWNYGKYNGRTKKRNDPEHWIAVSVPPIITADAWESAQKILAANRHNYQRKYKYEYLLRARCTCGVCMSHVGCRRSANGNKLYLYYTCGAKDKIHYVQSCASKAFRADKVDRLVWDWVRKYFDDPQLLLESLTVVKQESERQSTPLRERIATVDALLEDQQGQLSRLLDLYLTGDFEKNVLVDRRSRLDTTIASLERERSDLAGILENRTMSDDKIKRILAFANNQKTKVELATRNFETRRELIEELDVKATLVREKDEVIVYASCVLGEEKLRAASTTTIGLRR